jgi:hypothetical protein
MTLDQVRTVARAIAEILSSRPTESAPAAVIASYS